MPKLRIVCIGAHSDDLEIGMGGTISKFSERGDEVISVIMSTGEASSPWLKKNILIELREKEMISIAEYIGSKEVIFMGLKDGQLEKEIENPKVLETIKRLLQRYNPDRVYIHSKHDPHPDHRATNKISIKAIEQYDKERKISVYAFEVWNIKEEMHPRVYEDITKTFGKKIRAMKKFKSQWLFVYLLIIPVILRAIITGFSAKCKFAERFYKIR